MTVFRVVITNFTQTLFLGTFLRTYKRDKFLPRSFIFLNFPSALLPCLFTIVSKHFLLRTVRVYEKKGSLCCVSSVTDELHAWGTAWKVTEEGGGW